MFKYKQLPRSEHSFKWTEHPLYRVWHGMRVRCYKKNTPYYKNYGGRGITVCDEWMFNFETFVNDIGIKPSPNHSLDRIDNEKGYCKDNCRWATPTEQARNKRVYKTSETGYSGITITNLGYYHVRVRNEKTNLGVFKTLEEAVEAQRMNKRNNKPRVTNTTGLKGVTLQGETYLVRKVIDGKRVYLGNCNTLDEAKALYESGKKKNRTSNKTGVTGINFSTAHNKYVVRVKNGKTRHYVGAFKTLEEAKEALDEYKRRTT